MTLTLAQEYRDSAVILKLFPMREFGASDCAACGGSMAFFDAQDLRIVPMARFAVAEGIDFRGRCPHCSAEFMYGEGEELVFWQFDERRTLAPAGAARGNGILLRSVRLFPDRKALAGRADRCAAAAGRDDLRAEPMATKPKIEACPNCGAEELCEPCRAAALEARDAVAAGGVYYRCLECGGTGYVPATCEIAAQTRTHARLPAPLPCLLEFDACAEHADPEFSLIPWKRLAIPAKMRTKL